MSDMSPAPDGRWQNFIAGLGPDGRPKPMTYELLVSITQEWPLTEATPSGIARLLETSRAAFALAWFHYELLVVAASWSTLAIEAAFRDRLDTNDKPSFKMLLSRAVREEIINADDGERLDAGRQLRNGLVHAREQQAWTPGMAAPIVRTSHEVVGLLYPDA